MGHAASETLARDISDHQAADTSLQYTRENGQVETARSIEEAMSLCPFLGGMSLEEAEVFMSLIGSQQPAEAPKAAEAAQSHHETEPASKTAQADPKIKTEKIEAEIKETVTDEQPSQDTEISKTAEITAFSLETADEAVADAREHIATLHRTEIEPELQDEFLEAQRRQTLLEQESVYLNQTVHEVFTALSEDNPSETNQLPNSTFKTADFPISKAQDEIAVVHEEDLVQQSEPLVLLQETEYVPSSTANHESAQPDSDTETTEILVEPEIIISKTETFVQHDPDEADPSPSTKVEELTQELSELFVSEPEENREDFSEVRLEMDGEMYSSEERVMIFSLDEALVLTADVFEPGTDHTEQRPEPTELILVLQDIHEILERQENEPGISVELVEKTLQLLDALGIPEPENVLRQFAEKHSESEFTELLKVRLFELSEMIDNQSYLLANLQKQLQATNMPFSLRLGRSVLQLLLPQAA